MGYYMELVDQHFTIKKENQAAALQAIKDLAGQDSDASGRHFSWVSTDAFVNATDLTDAMDAWGWSVFTNPDSGDIDEIEFNHQKLGDDAILFTALGPFVEKDCYVEMRGEDGCVWCWKFNGDSCQEIHTTQIWNCQPGLEAFNEFLKTGQIPETNSLQTELTNAQHLMRGLQAYLVALDAAHK